MEQKWKGGHSSLPPIRAHHSPHCNLRVLLGHHLTQLQAPLCPHEPVSSRLPLHPQTSPSTSHGEDALS